MNEKAAKEWITKAWHHFSSAKVLSQANHYTDVIAIDLHYAVEIQLKAFLAYENKKIIKTHDLLELVACIENFISFEEDELDLLDQISKYHIQGSYPTPDRTMPSTKEINEVIRFTEKLFDRVCGILNINLEKLK